MNIEEIKSAFIEIRELRDKASEKEKQLIKHLEDDGMLSPADAILFSSGIASFGGSDNGRMLEALICAAVSKSL